MTGRIEFRDVTFVYPSKPDRVILDNFTLDVEHGKMTAIVGSSGSGKSTVVNLIERLYDAVTGHVIVDGHDIKSLDLNYFRSLIGYVPQEPVLFNSSIRDNIKFGRENITDEQVWEACKKAYADEFIRKIDDGLDYIVGLKGSKLSGGQKQRIAIARAILTQPKILILDEATSALDNKSEKEVQRALNKVSQGITTVVIAHRLSTIINADKIVVLEHGKIVEQGNHHSLLELNEKYAALIKHQMGAVDLGDLQVEVINEDKEAAEPMHTEAPLVEKEDIPRSRLERKNSFDELMEKIDEEKRNKETLEKLANDQKQKTMANPHGK